jgi:hypothetical protein
VYRRLCAGLMHFHRDTEWRTTSTPLSRRPTSIIPKRLRAVRSSRLAPHETELAHSLEFTSPTSLNKSSIKSRTQVSFISCASSASITWERIASRRRPAFSSHLVTPVRLDAAFFAAEFLMCKLSEKPERRAVFLFHQPKAVLRGHSSLGHERKNTDARAGQH